MWNRAFWRPAGQEPLADTAAAAASDAGAEVREPVPVGRAREHREDEHAAPAVRAAGRLERGLATARGRGHGGYVPAGGPRTGSERALRPLPGVMVGATAVMVAVTVALTVIAGPLYGYTDRAARDLLDRTPYIEAVFDGPVPAEEGE